MPRKSKQVTLVAESGTACATAMELPPALLHSLGGISGALLEAAAQAVLIADRTGRMIHVNRHAEEMFGYSRKELLGSSIELLLPSARRDAHARKRREFLQQPHVRAVGKGMDLLALRKDGSEFPVEVGLTYAETAEGTFAIALVVDIGERNPSIPDGN